MSVSPLQANAIFRIARYSIQPEAIADCQAAIREIVGLTHDEPGTLMYLVFQEAENPANLIHFSAYADAAALQAHVTGQPMLDKINAVISPVMIGTPTFTHYTLFDGKLLPALVVEGE
jgi:quinol monooxygenase YgiN